MQTKLTVRQKELIEKFGVFYERNGLSPAQARIVGLLMIVDQAELTFDEICRILGLSKSAVSAAISSLSMMGRIEYYTKPGDRKRYFFVNGIKSEKDIDAVLMRLKVTLELYQEILAGRSKANPKYNNDLKKLIEFTGFIYVELSEVFRKWKQKH